MADNTSRSGVTYTKAEDGYFEKRSLKRTAGVWGLWGIGIAAVISGDFAGWNPGLGVAGWGGLLIATAIIIVMFFTMIFATVNAMRSEVLSKSKPAPRFVITR